MSSEQSLKSIDSKEVKSQPVNKSSEDTVEVETLMKKI